MALKVGELFASFNVDSSGAMASVGSLITKTGDLQAAFIGLGEMMDRVLTRNIVNGAKDAIDTTMQFDAAMAKVAATAGIRTDSDAFTALRQQALDLAGSTKFTATEVASALYYMGLAGWKTEDMMAGLPGLLAMGAASGENLSTVSDILTDDITAMGDSALDAARYANIFAAASTNSNTSIAQMGEAMKYVGALGGTLNFTMEDLAIALGVLANNGIKGSQAGTSLRRILSNLAAPTSQSAGAMELLGLSLDDGTNNAISLYDYILALRTAFGDFATTPVFKTISEALSLEEGSEDASAYIAELTADAQNLGANLDKIGTKEWVEMSDAQMIQYLSEQIFDLMTSTGALAQLPSAALAKDLAGQYGLSALLALINTSQDDLQTLHDSIYGSSEGEGAAFTMAQTQLDNLQGSVTILQSALETAKITLTSIFTDDMQGVVDRVTELVQQFTQLPEGVQRTTVELLGIAAATGPMLMAIGLLGKYGELLSPLITGAFTPLGLMVGTGALMGIAALDDDNSVGEMLEDMSDWMGEKLEAFADYITDNSPEISERMGSLIESLTNVLTTMTPALAEAGFSLFEGLLGSMADNAEGLIGMGTSLMTTLISSITEALPSLGPTLLTAAASIFAALAEQIPAAAEAIGGLAGSLVGTLTNMILDPGTWSQLFNLGGAIIEGLVSGMLHFGKSLIGNAWESLMSSDVFGMSDQSYIDEYGEDWGRLAAENFAGYEAMMEYMTNGFTDYNGGLESFMEYYEWAAGILGEDRAYNIFGSLLEGAPEAIGATVDAAYEAVETAQEAVDTVSQLTEDEAAMYASLGSITTQLGLSQTDAGNGIADGITNGANAVEAAAAQLGSDAVNAALQALSYGDGYTAGNNFVQGIVAAIQGGAAQVAAAAASLSATFSGSISMSFSASGGGGGEATVSSIGSAISSLANRPVVLVQDGKTVAKVSSSYNLSERISSAKSIALGYGQ